MPKFATSIIAALFAMLASTAGLASEAYNSSTETAVPQSATAFDQNNSLLRVLVPKGFTPICQYGESCALIKPSLVAYGSDGRFLYKVLKGAFLCNERSFNKLPANPSTANCSVAITSESSLPQKQNASASALLKSGTYAIISAHSGKALEVSEHGVISQSPYDGLSNQHLTITALSNGYFTLETASHLALEVKDWNINDGAQISVATQVDSWSQQWRIDETPEGYVSITSRYNAKAFDLYGLNTHNSSSIRLWTFWGGRNQLWQLIAVASTALD